LLLESFVTPPVIVAAKSGKAQELASLLDSGQNVNLKDDNGNSVVFHAAENGHIECVAICIERQADVMAANAVRHLKWGEIKILPGSRRNVCLFLPSPAGLPFMLRSVATPRSTKDVQECFLR